MSTMFAWSLILQCLFINSDALRIRRNYYVHETKTYNCASLKQYNLSERYEKDYIFLSFTGKLDLVERHLSLFNKGTA